jgi:hypothetical protein
MVEKISRVDDRVLLEAETDRIAALYKIPETLEHIQLTFPGVFNPNRISVVMRRWGFMGIAYELISNPFQGPNLKDAYGIIYPGTQSEGAVWGTFRRSDGVVNEHFAVNIFVLPRVPVDEEVARWWKVRESKGQLDRYITPEIFAENVKHQGLTDQVCEINLGFGPFDDSDPHSRILLPSENPNQIDIVKIQQNIDDFIQSMPQRFNEFTGWLGKQWDVAAKRPIVSFDRH